MQRRKNIRLIISLVALVICTLLIFVFSSEQTNSSINKALFRLENLEKIDHIQLESSKGKTDLKFNGTKWMVDGQHEADRQIITVLFATLKQTIAKRKVATALQDSIRKQINKNGIKVSCFEGDRLSKEFWAGGHEQRTETYFQLSDGVPYVVTIPGYRIFVASILELPSNDWRDKRVFNFNWQNFKSLKSVLPSDTEQNFKVSFKDKFFGIDGITSVDTTKLNNYLDAISLLRAEKILTVDQAKEYDSLTSQTSFVKIIVQDIANRTYELKLFPMQKGNNFCIGKMNGTEVIEIKLSAAREILRKKEFFIQH